MKNGTENNASVQNKDRATQSADHPPPTPRAPTPFLLPFTKTRSVV